MCDEVSETGVRCQNGGLPSEHRFHMGRDADRQVVSWPSAEFIAPMARTSPERFRDLATAAGAPPRTDRAETSVAIQQVDDHANAQWRTEARAVLADLARRMPTLTSEDVRNEMTAETHTRKALGPVMTWGKTQGLIHAVKCGHCNSYTYREYENGRHQSPSLVWTSRVYREEVSALALSD